MNPIVWQSIAGYEDILYQKGTDGIAKITIHRGREGYRAFLEKRPPDFERFNRLT